jgi:hypothetical protein
LIIVVNGTAASGYTPEPECVLSPRLDEMSDEVADIRVQTLHSLASASEDRYAPAAPSLLGAGTPHRQSRR